MNDKEKKEISEMVGRRMSISNYDKGIHTCCKTLLVRENPEAYQKMKDVIEDFNVLQCIGHMTETDKHFMMNGGALMYQLMTNKNFKSNENTQKS